MKSKAELIKAKKEALADKKGLVQSTTAYAKPVYKL